MTARKVSQCSKTQRGADGYAMIKSVVETAKRQAQHRWTSWLVFRFARLSADRPHNSLPCLQPTLPANTELS